MSDPAKKLGELHGVLADALAESIGKLEPGDKGLAAIMEVARKFLADNGIDTANASPGSPTGRLVEATKKYPFNPADSMSQH